MSKLVVPDGEYEVEVSELLQAHLLNLHTNNTTNLRNQRNDDILSIRYNSIPDNVDKTKPFELTKEDKKLGSFQLKTDTITENEYTTFEGLAAESKDIDCILIYDESTQKFELQRLGYLLRATSAKTSKVPTAQEAPAPSTSPSLPEKKPDLQKKKKRVKEPSVFQPKARSKTPTSATVTKRASSAPIAANEDVLPTVVKSPTNLVSSSRVAVASPLSSSYTAATFPQMPGSGTSPPKKKPTPLSTSSNIKVSTPRMPESRSTPSPYNEPEQRTLSSPFPRLSNSQVSSKKPPSTITTPIIPHQSEGDDEDEFGDLANELEEELLSEDNEDGFITVDNGDEKKKKRNLPIELSKKDGPINFRNLAGITNNNEDDLSSSEEE